MQATLRQMCRKQFPEVRNPFNQLAPLRSARGFVASILEEIGSGLLAFDNERSSRLAGILRQRLIASDIDTIIRKRKPRLRRYNTPMPFP